MKRISFNILFILLFLSSLCFAKEETVQITTYYPAPFGDYEHLKTNSLEVYNVIVSPDVTDPKNTSKFKPIRFLNNIRVLKENAGPYTSDRNYFDSMNVPNFIDIDAEHNRIVFYDVGQEVSSGLFFVDAEVGRSYEQGIVYDEYAGEKTIAIRNKGDIYLQPGFNKGSIDGTDHAFYSETTGVDGRVVIEGELAIDEIYTKDGRRLFLVGPLVSSRNENRSIEISDKIYINPVGTEVVVRGNLTVEGDLDVKGQLGASTGIETLRVNTLITNRIKSTKKRDNLLEIQNSKGARYAIFRVPDNDGRAGLVVPGGLDDTGQYGPI